MSDVPDRLGRPLLLGDKETEGTFDDIPVMYVRSLYTALTKTTIATYAVRMAMTGLL
jgi:hypothetical protein